MRRVRRSERGETLLELLVALSIMSVAVVTIVGAIATTIRLSDVHRRQTVARGYLTAFAESIEIGVAATPTAYKACAATDGSDYDALYATPPAPYQRKVVSVDYWRPALNRFVATACTAANDVGVQRLKLRVWATGSSVDEQVQIVIRKPCRSGETCT